MPGKKMFVRGDGELGEMIDKLSIDQERKVLLYQKKWSDCFFKNGFNEKDAVESIDWFYGLIGKKSPIKLVLDSPLAVQLAISLFKNEKFGSQLDSQLSSQLSSQLYSQLHSQLYSQLHSQLHSQLEFKKIEKYNFDWWGTITWYGYCCFYDFINTELLPTITIPLFNEYKKIVKSK